MSARNIAVIDIGKTNKKVLVFDTNLKLLDSAYQTFPEYQEDGVNLEDVTHAFEWMKTQLAVFSKRHHFQALSITTHGATAVCIDRNGNLAVPPIAYTNQAGDDFSAEFFREFGNREILQQRTATAEVGSMINVAKLLYFARKRWPDRFKNTWKILNYPQYFGYLFTGKIGAEPTYTGCHTYLFDFEKKTYSDVARKMGILDLLPETISKSWEVLGTVSPQVAAQTGLPAACLVTMGIHDSNSSLLPYLVKGYKNFVLNSTGTWCVAMHPTNKVQFKGEELGKLVFYNMDAFFNPVKTSIFMGGMEFETYTEILKAMHGAKDYPPFNPEVYRKVIAERELFILPSVVKGTGLFPDARPRAVEYGQPYALEDIREKKAVPEFFGDYAKAVAVLNLSLALQTRTALDMVDFNGTGNVFTEGGFRKNADYNALLTALYPKSKVALTQLEEATAFGAAILGKAAMDKTTPMETAKYFEIGIRGVEPQSFKGLSEYADAFHKLLRRA
ncbi:MAG: hypothetical protein A3K19_27970 [Lentisphaerae bacterium RIFOXYB12_FULL_65_16]|nr:MAG: hypothetical protein A3K18_02630 [Lentisphaerae bacterium RIFOXYA12_64_32]OGV88131.1 MAG: hypothetical protein A3K19_27970 [Lentisphaerae bacterium RIFOXYB12_FULL_65_16]